MHHSWFGLALSKIIFMILQLFTFVRSDELEKYYPKARPRSRNYSCCVYDENLSDQEYYCRDEDKECIDDFRTLMNKYYIATVVISVASLVMLIVACITSAKREKRKKAKKGPISNKDKDSSRQGEAGSDDERTQKRRKDGDDHSEPFDSGVYNSMNTLLT